MLRFLKLKAVHPYDLWHESTLLKSEHLAGVLRVIIAFVWVIPTPFYPALAQGLQGQGIRNELDSCLDSNNVVEYSFTLCEDVSL